MEAIKDYSKWSMLFLGFHDYSPQIEMRFFLIWVFEKLGISESGDMRIRGHAYAESGRIRGHET